MDRRGKDEFFPYPELHRQQHGQQELRDSEVMVNTIWPRVVKKRTG